ncbi:MAG: phosphoribosylaminoimidazolesuccinocarboxamide synthase [Bacteroidetes bacterium]|nr:phosphoribosylaminoimidazolesuccinocarboxamide synthase [Bacteroidota bacterium]
MNTLKTTSFHFPGQTMYYKGKVRDVYTIDNKYMVMIVSDRISAFDVVLPEAIPFKGQVLNQLAAYFMEATKEDVPNWILAVPDPNVTIGKMCVPYRVEMVIRGYLAGHAWRTYKSGGRELCGVILPEGLKENDKLPHPIITPTTKSNHGHDEDISREAIIENGVVGEDDYLMLEKYTHKLFQRGTEMAAQQGLILVDTKYEFGKSEGEIMVIDEIHTPDSSRYFYSNGYEERQLKGIQQKQLSKEFLRQWLIENNFQGLEGQVVPEMNSEIVNMVSERYIELYEIVRGEKFVRAETTSVNERVENNILNWLKELRK